MGMFDSVYADCPNCGAKVEFQSKAGECLCNNYTVETAPAEVLRDILNEPEYCAKCGEWSVLYDPKFPPNPPSPPRPTPTLRAVRQPNADEFSMHATQTFIRWWQAPFTEADLVPLD